MKKKTAANQEDQVRNRDEVIKRVFEQNYIAGAKEVLFSMDQIRDAIANVAKLHPGYKENNVADVRYQYASGRRALPCSVDKHGPWMILGRGKAQYAFVKLTDVPQICVQDDLATIWLPDATPEIVLAYAGADEQGILAKVHYNRLLDIFLQRRGDGYFAARSKNETAAGSSIGNRTDSSTLHILDRALPENLHRIEVAHQADPITDALFRHL